MPGTHRKTPRWLFAYGSLIWKPEPEFRQREIVSVSGWARRFWQGSPDHRGTPAAPGRVVTLVPESGALCWGVAYDISCADMDRLDLREAGGYARVTLDVADRAGVVRPAITYVGDATNPWYLGPASDAEVAAQVLRSAGPSGANPEYVLRLAAALRQLGVTDAHVFAIDALVRDKDSMNT